MLQLSRNGLILQSLTSLDESQGSSNVKVNIQNDGTYTNYSTQLHYGYYVHGFSYTKGIARYENGVFILPREAFEQYGLLNLSVLLVSSDEELMTNQVQFIVQAAPRGDMVIDDIPSAQQQVLQLVQTTLDQYAHTINLNKNEIAVLKSRMDSFTQLQEGSTTGDAELIDGRVGYDGKKYENIGDAIRGQVSQLSDDIYDLKNAKKYFSVSVFELAESIENVFKNVVFNNANTEFDYLSNIVKQIKPEGLVSIKYSIKNCTINTSARYLLIGDSFTATITPNENTEFQGITVTMNGKDVTEIVVSDKTINISEVTGDILIVATSKSLYWADGYEVLNYVYSSGTGDAYIDTNWIMTDLNEKMVIGVQLSETNPTNSAGAFLGVNADSAFDSVYTAIELAQQNVDRISVGWGSYNPTSNSFMARYNEDLKSKIHYVSLTNGEQKLWEDEDMNVLYTGTFAANTQKYTMDDSRIPPFPVWLFRSNIQDVAHNSASKKKFRSPGVKISCFKVYDADGTLVVNMRASKRSSDGAIGFYDTVRQRFFENVCETGELIGG